MQASGASIIAFVVFAASMAACGGGTNPSSPTSNPSPTLQAVEPTATAVSPRATAESTIAVAPLPTPNVVGPPSANPVPGSCLVLEEQYCNLGERVSWQTPWGASMDVIGFRLPVGAIVFSPFDYLVNATEAPSENAMNPDATTVTVYSGSDPSAPMLQAVGDFALELAAQQPSTTAGTPLARVQDTGVRIFSGDYNLIVAFARSAGTEGFVADDGLLAQLFPNLGLN